MAEEPAAVPLTDSRYGRTLFTNWNHHRAVILILKLSLGFNVLILIGLSTTYIVKEYDNKNEKVQNVTDTRFLLDVNNGDYILCLPCNSLGEKVQRKDTIYDAITTSKSGQKVCCMTKHADIQRFLIKIILLEKNGQGNIPADIWEDLDWWTKRPYSAHLSLHNKPDNGTAWKDYSRNRISFTNDLDLMNNSIGVPINGQGVYLIYSVITQDFSSENEIPISFHQIVKTNQYITRKGVAIEDNLQMAKYGGTKKNQDTHTSCIFRVVKLSQMDYVMVRFGSGPRNFEFVQEGILKNFFGMFKL